MSAIDHLPVDLADLQDIRLKLPEAKRLYEAKRKELDDLVEQVEYWGALVDILARLVGEEGIERPQPRAVGRARVYGGGYGVPVRPARQSAPGQEAAAEALERAGRPMGPSALYRFMLAEGMKAPSSANALGANLWAAERTGRVKKTPDGDYAPLTWEPEQKPLASDASGE
jgi:hypothetical protein